MADVLTEVRKRRGPATRIVIGLVVAWAVLRVVSAAVAVLTGTPVLTAVRSHAQSLYSVPVLLVLVLSVVAAVWVRPRVPNARALARAATVVASVVVGVAIVAGIVGLWSPDLRGSQRALAVADLVVSSVVPVLLCVALATIAGAAARSESAAEPAPAEQPEALQGAWTTTGGTGPSTDTTDESPTWAPDVAAGAAWTSAAEAAQGGTAAWGDQRAPAGWQSGSAPALGPGAPDDAGDPSSPDTPGRTTASRLERSLWDVPPREEE